MTAFTDPPAPGLWRIVGVISREERAWIAPMTTGAVRVKVEVGGVIIDDAFPVGVVADERCHRRECEHGSGRCAIRGIDAVKAAERWIESRRRIAKALKGVRWWWSREQRDHRWTIEYEV